MSAVLTTDWSADISPTYILRGVASAVTMRTLSVLNGTRPKDQLEESLHW